MMQNWEMEENPKRLRRDVLLNVLMVVLCLVLLIQAVAFFINLADYQHVYTADEASLISMVSDRQYDTLMENVYRNEAYGVQKKGDMEQLYAVAYYYEAAMLYHAHRSAGNDAAAEQNYNDMLKYEKQMGEYAFAKDEIWEYLGIDPEILK